MTGASWLGSIGLGLVWGWWLAMAGGPNPGDEVPLRATLVLAAPTLALTAALAAWLGAPAAGYLAAVLIGIGLHSRRAIRHWRARRFYE